eukprot:CAMPEP_0197692702 /NCGR_PEP_ID=MMETSP1338-20131121/111494_1 /TAXON_ID=43686 ORGANISM="Pelagodinium beii, Strain RCC1491" /NCGR_SAMPLE_ID=MMETSP1338 /ASSEMBLY_ACC=CAM_ASM_000754 /LENGTH=106 /DNA_ID=CAMNT_0043275387 /DNA_START=241 /DNA_END=558 /DNA_ORIENTATION=+
MATHKTKPQSTLDQRFALGFASLSSSKETGSMGESLFGDGKAAEGSSFSETCSKGLGLRRRRSSSPAPTQGFTLRAFGDPGVCGCSSSSSALHPATFGVGVWGGST